MPDVRPAPGRMVSFRLSDLPPAVLARGRDSALREIDDFSERLAIGALADDPARSRKVHWVSETAWKRVMRGRSVTRGRTVSRTGAST